MSGGHGFAAVDRSRPNASATRARSPPTSAATPARIHSVEEHVAFTEDGPAIATGRMLVGWCDVVRRLGARATGPDRRTERRAKVRFVGLFVGSLWDVCARKVLSYAPF